ncbi:hypothetical protein NB231_16588 [Nitrococcus mobilis Nb-231]|uniref:O-antigen ligase-related domain-containing protein n=1 Tax=Nitrococcus mobilis Nb-231 TaxID=314278 RepID=A4BMB8_9GAMM|nr:hypothetical protein NB231_16588 [Nitrococcus mobilis Nb-231]
MAGAALLVLGLGALHGVALGHVALGTLLLLLVADSRRAGPLLGRAWFFWVTLAYLTFLLLEYLLAWFNPGPWHFEPGEAFLSYVEIGFLAALVTGYWLFRFPRLALAVFLLIPAGLITRVIFEWDMVSFHRVVDGWGRFTFGDSAVKFGLWALLSTVVGIALLRSVVTLTRTHWRWALLGYLLVVIVLGGFGVLFSKTRSVWAISVIAIPAVAMLTAWPYTPRRRLSVVMVAAACIAGIFVLGIGWAFEGVVSKRWVATEATFWMLIQGDWSQLPFNSVSARLQMAREGLQVWLERPFLGHGFGSAPYFLEHSTFKEVAVRHFEHFHNTPVNLLAEFGLVGLAFFVVLFWASVFFLRGALVGDRSGVSIASAMGLFVMGVQSFFDHVIVSHRGPFMIALFCGVAVASHLERLRPRAP